MLLVVSLSLLLSGCMYEREDDNPKDTLHKRSPKVKQIELTVKPIYTSVSPRNSVYTFHYNKDVLTSIEYDEAVGGEVNVGTQNFEYGSDYYSVISEDWGEIGRFTYYPDESVVEATAYGGIGISYYYEEDHIVSTVDRYGHKWNYTWENGNIVQVSYSGDNLATMQYTNYDYDASVDFMVLCAWTGLRGVFNTGNFGLGFAPLNSGYKTSKLPASATVGNTNIKEAEAYWLDFSYEFNKDNLVSKVVTVVTSWFEDSDGNWFKGTAWTTTLKITYY